MKKIIVVLISIMLLVAAVACYAESQDYASMPMDELIEIRNSVNAEIASRLDHRDGEIFPGRYIVGVDIIPGEYLATYVAPNDANCLIRVYQETDSGALDIIDECSISEGDKGRVKFEEGNIVKVFNCSCNLESIAKASWAP